MAKVIVTLVDGETIVLVKTHDLPAAKRVKKDLKRWIKDGNVIIFPFPGPLGASIREVPGSQIVSVEIVEISPHAD